ncbi:response regulator transcription factor [Lyngbya confervoides]|uniref:Response regulator transcription factor n=1 Tax=Lyngbya confervoides BDU141951 TaxID=1574623 RepID=A0ABD4T794_9CYAN|nr:response regulator transcription factor [Lyngbya confervoides]MCM1984162.1 response regulator transcription factor [Lyngbya confervoides BDU141951]
MSAHLLLVDDEPGLREAVQAYLEDSGFTVDVASNAKMGWEMLERRTPDLVISDIMMPQVDGYEFLQQMREDPRFKKLPVVFLTARGMTKDRIEGYQASVDAYLSKPFDPDELVAVVSNLIQRHSQLTEGSTTDIEELANQVAEIRAILKNQPQLSRQKTELQIDFTPREQSVLELVSQGLMNKEIASQLNTSVRNVEKYVSRLFSKTETNSRTELVRFALENGLAK